MLIYIVRHGETKVNTEGRLCGHIDTPLNENGRLLGRLTGEGLAEVKFDEVISSPLSRAYETAQLILANNNFSKDLPIATDRRLMEASWGPWEMKICIPEGYELEAPDFNDFYRDPFNFPFPEGCETMRELCVRTGEFFDELVARPELQDKTILLTSHGCAVRGLLNRVFEDKDDFWHGCCPPNCAVNVVRVEHGKAELLEFDKIFYDPALSKNLFQES